MIDGKTIGLDSFKIRAQNSLKNNFNERKVKRHLAYLDKRIQEYESQLDEEDDESVRSKLEYQASKREAYKAIREDLKKQEMARCPQQIQTLRQWCFSVIV